MVASTTFYACAVVILLTPLVLGVPQCRPTGLAQWVAKLVRPQYICVKDGMDLDFRREVHLVRILGDTPLDAIWLCIVLVQVAVEGNCDR